ncbi:uncharacterized protein LOC133294178 [Gastrolobium bilobum]|uniref:uncharacterized protein LOC133294178 n=1 Tax=Gastrolobium bilobum TaxID=150636 RepID=UPI002AB1723B|nr:uncharacterized protein LOC133294178 [Gastrolobium bilobum]
MHKVWEKTLIVKLLGRTTGVAFMKKKLETLWAIKGKINITDIGNDYYVVQFSEGDDLNFALNGGPWVVLGNYLALRKWQPAFRPHAEGKLIKIDRTTNAHARGRFARICVELDLAKPLKGEYVLEGMTKQIEYEGLGLICFKCGRYGHSKECCAEPQMNTAAMDGDHAREKENEDEACPIQNGLGPWMVVNRQRRFKGQGTTMENQSVLTTKRNLRRNQGEQIVQSKRTETDMAALNSKFEVLIDDEENQHYELEKNAVGPEANQHLRNVNSKGVNHGAKLKQKSISLEEHADRYTLIGVDSEYAPVNTKKDELANFKMDMVEGETRMEVDRTVFVQRDDENGVNNPKAPDPNLGMLSEYVLKETQMEEDNALEDVEMVQETLWSVGNQKPTTQP